MLTFQPMFGFGQFFFDKKIDVAAPESIFCFMQVENIVA